MTKVGPTEVVIYVSSIETEERIIINENRWKVLSFSYKNKMKNVCLLQE